MLQKNRVHENLSQTQTDLMFKGMVYVTISYHLCGPYKHGLFCLISCKHVKRVNVYSVSVSAAGSDIVCDR